ncbi:2-C-methyl-D-erythritol 4-phosphate cytidylyltransferase [Alkalihalobacillus oceani]|uniref:2-C-methyl-D-erythritol 4-phosphate cytidylyltransferase n=1 Tax=Halalkalibacter oceani TaxID=1653776 RepID=UPI00203E4279|nr:2-C-methyl-D-erythritol 4-phosphate cytidylyltransferase [Halalkalibacter oceani]MCM3762408.1 2-C-methyl-D-erythritol 4-phosphate cytidylyltransferase [Halalkalibacter oceani]
MKYSVVIPAAGQGKRMKAGRNKQFLKLQGEEIIVHTVRLFEQDPSCRRIVVVANPEEVALMNTMMDKRDFKKVTVATGGKERQDSVRNGLQSLEEDGIILVHDGARPFVEQRVIDELVERAGERGAAIAAVRVKDTIKRVEGDSVVETLKRDELWAVQTPQAFQAALLRQAHAKAEQEGYTATDDASLIEWIGRTVVIVEGSYHNLKLTTPEDMTVAHLISKERERNG